MSYINVGAKIDGHDAPSKKALKLTLADHPERVEFYSTSPMGPQFVGTPDKIPAGFTLSVVGPDPFRSRKFYASVTNGPKGVRLT